MLYTREGDNGKSGLYNAKGRLPKNDPVYSALGTLDELNSLLGICRARSSELKPILFRISSLIEKAEENIFLLQAEVAGAPKFIPASRVEEIEYIIDEIEKYIKKPDSFVVYGATELSAFLDFARAVSRRAEREVFGLNKTRTLSSSSLAYLNRLSSLLYALARYSAFISQAEEKPPKY